MCPQVLSPCLTWSTCRQQVRKHRTTVTPLLLCHFTPAAVAPQTAVTSRAAAGFHPAEGDKCSAVVHGVCRWLLAGPGCLRTAVNSSKTRSSSLVVPASSRHVGLSSCQISCCVQGSSENTNCVRGLIITDVFCFLSGNILIKYIYLMFATLRTLFMMRKNI